MSIVRQLQKDALDSNVTVTELLRKAVLIAQKLNLSNTEKWLIYERSGYPDDVKPPDYRIINVSSVQAWNPYAGWVRVASTAPELEEALSGIRAGQSLASLEAAVIDGENRYFSLPGAYSNHGTDLRFSINLVGLSNIVNTVRDAVLDWAVALEGQNILGEDISFSNEEKQIAKELPLGVQLTGTFPGAKIQINSPHGQQNIMIESSDVASLKDLIPTLLALLEKQQFRQEVHEELKAEIDTLDAQAKSPKPKRGVIIESLKSIRSVLENAAGGALATSAPPMLSELISRLGG